MKLVAHYVPEIADRDKVGIDSKYITYARKKIPDISEELIHRNLCEIITAYDAELTCKSCCMGIDMCPELMNSAGYTYTMLIQPSGWIKIEYSPCMFNGGKEEITNQQESQFVQGKIFG